jgi:hypothetical protein
MNDGLLQEDILRKFKFGIGTEKTSEDVFYEVIADEIDQIASFYGCEADISVIKLLEAHSYWLHDLENLRVSESEEPCHLKHAGWLCHWLRKKSIVSRLIVHQSERLSVCFENHFNEVIAFAIGLKLVVFYECTERGLSDEAITASVAQSSVSDLLHDVAVYLSHKNVSPHAIYLIYAALMRQSPIRAKGVQDVVLRVDNT